jgi:hypothetical protein
VDAEMFGYFNPSHRTVQGSDCPDFVSV